MGEFYLLIVALVFYYIFDMRDRKKERLTVRRAARASIFGAFIASSMRYIVAFRKRKHKFSSITNNYTLIRKRLSIPNSNAFNIPMFELSR